MPAQMKALFDATGGLWTSGKLAGKPAAMFTATASQGGGQETTIQNCENLLTSCACGGAAALQPLLTTADMWAHRFAWIYAPCYHALSQMPDGVYGSDNQVFHLYDVKHLSSAAFSA